MDESVVAWVIQHSFWKEMTHDSLLLSKVSHLDSTKGFFFNAHTYCQGDSTDGVYMYETPNDWAEIKPPSIRS